MHRLRIGFDGRPLIEGEIRGFSRYTFELLRALQRWFADDIELYSFSPAPVHRVFSDGLALNGVVFDAAREVLWEQYELPRQLSRHRIDLFHSTANRGLPAWRVCPYVLTLHDIVESMRRFVPRGSLKSHLRRSYSNWISIHNAGRIITVSEHSRRDICSYWKVPAARVTVIYEAADSVFFERTNPADQERVRRRYRLPESYLLYLGGFDAKKNVTALVNAYSLVAGDPTVPPLVLAGEHKWGFLGVHDRIDALNLSNRIFTPGGIASEDVAALYKGAVAFVYPSLYEGFGLQLLEAMASGVPVLASDRTSFPEVLAGAGLLFNPRDIREIAGAIERMSLDPELRADLRERGFRRVGEFSWQKTAEQTVQVYCELLGQCQRGQILEEVS